MMEKQTRLNSNVNEVLMKYICNTLMDCPFFSYSLESAKEVRYGLVYDHSTKHEEGIDRKVSDQRAAASKPLLHRISGEHYGHSYIPHTMLLRHTSPCVAPQGLWCCATHSIVQHLCNTMGTL